MQTVSNRARKAFARPGTANKQAFARYRLGVTALKFSVYAVFVMAVVSVLTLVFGEHQDLLVFGFAAYVMFTIFWLLRSVGMLIKPPEQLYSQQVYLRTKQITILNRKSLDLLLWCNPLTWPLWPLTLEFRVALVGVGALGGLLGSLFGVTAQGILLGASIGGAVHFLRLEFLRDPAIQVPKEFELDD